MLPTAFKVGNGQEVLTILFSVEAAKDFISNVEFAIDTNAKTGDVLVTVKGSLVSLD